MTGTQKAHLLEWAFRLATVAFAAGLAWALLGAQVEQKLDTSRFVIDSLNRSTRDTLFVERFDRIESQQIRILRAVCADKVGGCQ